MLTLNEIIPDALAKEMQRLRVAILSAEHRGDWAAAETYRCELKECHDLIARREYRAR